MAIPSFAEYMKNREDIIMVQLFPYEKEEDLGTFERTFLITKAKNEAAKCNCIIDVFENKHFAYTNMAGENPRGAYGRMRSGRWGVFVTGTEAQLKKMFGGKNTISTKWTQEIEVFAMNGSSFDKTFIVNGKIYS